MHLEQYMKKIQEKWDLKDLRIESRLNAKGGRFVSLIESNKGRHVMKMFPSELDELRIKKYTEAIEYISNKKELKIAPTLLHTIDNGLYIKFQDYYVYIMEYIEGRQVKDTLEDEYKLGQASAFLHTISDYSQSSCLDINDIILNMKNRFKEYPFKSDYDKIVDNLPDFNQYKQTFIHTDIGPHNAIMTNKENIVFIDFDDAGMGSPFIDIGYPLITQFVQFNKKTKAIKFNEEIAKAFYQGYFSIHHLSDQEKELIFDGAVFMQLMYMPCYGPDAVYDMWEILKFGIKNKNRLLSTIL